jgi:disulfide bond formation protein DsbB
MPSNSSVATIIGIYSGIVLITVYFMEFVLGYKPCDLCIIQRYPYFTLVILSVAFITLTKKGKIINKLIPPIAIISCIFIGLFIAIYHFGIENYLWKNLSSCSDQLIGINIDTDNLLLDLDQIKPNCSDPVEIFSLSLSGYNIISNTIMLGISIYGYFFFRRKSN